jgi:hypothetical protein
MATADLQDVLEARNLEEGLPSRSGAFLLKGAAGQRAASALKDAASFFEGVPEDEVRSGLRTRV